MKKDWYGYKVSIIGLSKSGIAVAKYLLEKGADCTISEVRKATEADKTKIQELNKININVEMGANNPESFLGADVVITSPGVPPESEIIKFIRTHNIPLYTEVELAYREADSPFIAITGTNGKTTTTKLTADIFQQAGYNAPACGNIGDPIIDFIEQKPDFLIAELSSGQLEYSPTLRGQTACFINYAPDHIDWHNGEESYFKAKQSLFLEPKTPIIGVFNANDEVVMKVASECDAKKIFFGKEIERGNCVFAKDGQILNQVQDDISKECRREEIIALQDIPLIGRHNYENTMAAIALAKAADIETYHIVEAIKKFCPPEHRLEYVDTVEGKRFYNDSKATNPESAICALNSFEEPVILILGGKDKGTNLDELIKTAKEKALFIILVGEARERFQQELKNSGYKNIIEADSIRECIDKALKLTSNIVLFSPACASFDMFKNFEERGNAFKEYVKKRKKS